MHSYTKRLTNSRIIELEETVEKILELVEAYQGLILSSLRWPTWPCAPGASYNL